MKKAIDLIANAASMYDAHGQMPGSLELAYLGDAVYDIYARFLLAPTGAHMKQMHLAASRLVCAHAQSEAFSRIEAAFNEEEAGVARRARNRRQNPPRNADPAEYHKATAIEAVMGYLCIKGEYDRLDALMRAALSAAPEDAAAGKEESREP